MKDKINIYKLKDNYSDKLNNFIEDLDNKTKKAIDDGNNINK